MFATCIIFISLHYTRSWRLRTVPWLIPRPSYHPSLQCIESDFVDMSIVCIIILAILHAGLEQANKIASQHNFVGVMMSCTATLLFIQLTPAICWHAKYNESPYIIKPDRNTFIHLQLFPCAQEEGLMVRWHMPTSDR